MAARAISILDASVCLSQRVEKSNWTKTYHINEKLKTITMKKISWLNQKTQTLLQTTVVEPLLTL